MGQSVHSLGFRLGKSFLWPVGVFFHVSSSLLYSRFVHHIGLVFGYMEFFLRKYEKLFFRRGFIPYKVHLEVIGCRFVFFIDVFDVSSLRLFKSLRRVVVRLCLISDFRVFSLRNFFGMGCFRYFLYFLKGSYIKIRGLMFFFFFWLVFKIKLFLVRRSRTFLVRKDNRGFRVDLSSGQKFSSFFLRRSVFFFLRSLVHFSVLRGLNFLSRILCFKFSKLPFCDKYFFEFRFLPAFGNIGRDIGLVRRYVVYKLYNRFSLYESVRPFLYNILRLSSIRGFFALGNGRFTRKQRAFYIKYSVGKLSFSTVSAKLYYVFSKVKTKYGMCGVHLWLNYDYKSVQRLSIKNFVADA